MDRRKTLGVLGGMGPAATALFLEEVVRHTKAECDQDHLDVVVLCHASLPDRTDAIVSGAEGRLATQLVEDARRLEALGAQVLVLPCNTAHLWLPLLRRKTNLQILDMVGLAVDEAARALQGYDKGRRLGVLATWGTVRCGLYEEAGRRAGIEVVYPSREGQRAVSRAILQVKAGHITEAVGLLGDVYEELERARCEVAVLGCTELSVVHHRCGTSFSGVCVDPFDVLVRAAIGACGGTYLS